MHADNDKLGQVTKFTTVGGNALNRSVHGFVLLLFNAKYISLLASMPSGLKMGLFQIFDF